MALDNADVLDNHGVLHGVYRKHAAAFPGVLSGHHFHLVSLADLNPEPLGPCVCQCHDYQTSGASETILVNFFSRSSRATGPNTRVPMGSSASLISTAALSSNRMYVPSLRRCSLRMRTITHFTTLPSLIWLSGVASFTDAVTMSPNPAFNPASPPTGKMHISLRAPELSATVSQVRI